MKTGLPFLAFAEAELFHKIGGGITEPGRDGRAHRLLRDFVGAGPAVVGVAVFRGFRENDGDMTQNNPTFRHANALDRLKAADGEVEGSRSGEADVFGGEDHHAAGDKLRIFPALNHASEIIEGGVDVGAAHGLDKGRGVVVMIVARFVIWHSFLADGGFDDLFVDFVGKTQGELEVAEGGAGVAAGEVGDKLEGFVGDAGFGVFGFDGALQDFKDAGFVEGRDDDNAGAGDERGDDFEAGVFGGGADEDDEARLDVREKGVLLSFVETVNFVHEEDGAGF